MKTTKRCILPLLLALLMLAALCGCTDINDYSAKPVIYLYPEEETEVTVLLDYDGTLTTTYPAYGSGWQVTARPDGTLTDAQGREYSYLFWEGMDDSETEYDFSQGFCVRGEDTAAFLQQVLAEMGLLPEEYNEFIVYWLPQMEGNEWNLISFQGAAYTDHARLTVTPEPDSVLRVFMAWKPVDEEVELPAQQFDAFRREGFTLVEWGGCRVQE
ncbi:MAG: hypothetical protein LIO51_09185 [Clostridiales bacterium]|nr:hypothetical protein [Clostridiales bacterium]